MAAQDYQLAEPDWNFVFAWAASGSLAVVFGGEGSGSVGVDLNSLTGDLPTNRAHQKSDPGVKQQLE